MTKSKDTSSIINFFNVLDKASLTANEFYVLFYLYNINTDKLQNYNFKEKSINFHKELRSLVLKNWLKNTNDVMAKLDIKSLELSNDRISALITKLEESLKTKSTIIKETVITLDFEANVIKYNELFPKRKLGSGKPARSNVKNLNACFKWFFENHEYSWDIIFKATNNYLNKEEESNYKYTRTSQYFIKKQDNTDKSVNSELANFCQLMLDGDDSSSFVFSEKVV
jgi:hypothetical protein